MSRLDFSFRGTNEDAPAKNKQTNKQTNKKRNGKWYAAVFLLPFPRLDVSRPNHGGRSASFGLDATNGVRVCAS